MISRLCGRLPLFVSVRSTAAPSGTVIIRRPLSAPLKLSSPFAGVCAATIENVAAAPPAAALPGPGRCWRASSPATTMAHRQIRFMRSSCLRREPKRPPRNWVKTPPYEPCEVKTPPYYRKREDAPQSRERWISGNLCCRGAPVSAEHDKGKRSVSLPGAVSSQTAALPLLQGTGQDRKELHHVERLDQVPSGPGGEQTFTVRGCGIGGDHDHREMAGLGVFLQPAQHLIARDIRQVLVQQNQRGLVLLSQFQAEASLHCRGEPELGAVRQGG